MTVRLRPDGTVRLLREDPELLRHAEPRIAAAVAARSVVPSFTLDTGPWKSPEVNGGVADFGFIVLEGLLLRKVVCRDRSAAEVLGRGDVLRPWQQDEAVSISTESSWRALQPTRLASLTSEFLALAAGCAGVLAELQARTIRRAHTLAVCLALAREPRLEVRLLAVLETLAHRLGTQEGGDAVVPLPLSQETLGELACASRARTSAALRRLSDRGLLVRRADRTWLIPHSQRSDRKSHVA